ncbi:hypothetical protein PG996_002474 [Apiospora saccharicola]|uniref:Uncharacterized protein n=1 Tax=Apiospora saccharicola TaxID=335842 RepID=A0ABR1WJS1_9PEZI
MLYATLAHEGRNIGTLEWRLAQPNCPRRCKAVGDAHLFTALLEAAPMGVMRENHPYYYDAARRADVCLWKKLDILLESGCMDLHSPIDTSPTQTYLDNLTLLMNRDDQPETCNKILGPKRLRAFHWNNTKNHLTPLSYAMNHFVSVDLRSGKDHHEQYVASLQIAFYLIRKGADPRRVDDDVRRKVSAQWRRQVAAAYNALRPSQPLPPQLLEPFYEDHEEEMMTAQQFWEHSKDLDNFRRHPHHIQTWPISFVAANTNVIPAYLVHTI